MPGVPFALPLNAVTRFLDTNVLIFISLEPSNLTPFIFIAFCNLVAVNALPFRLADSLVPITSSPVALSIANGLNVFQPP